MPPLLPGWLEIYQFCCPFRGLKFPGFMTNYLAYSNWGFFIHKRSVRSGYREYLWCSWFKISNQHQSNKCKQPI